MDSLAAMCAGRAAHPPGLRAPHREGLCLRWFSEPRFYLLKAVNEATCTWSGQLPPRNYKNPIYSCKVFLGGVPWDITEGGCLGSGAWGHWWPACVIWEQAGSVSAVDWVSPQLVWLTPSVSLAL